MSCTTAGMNELKACTVHCVHMGRAASVYALNIFVKINFKVLFKNYWVLLFYLEGTLSEPFFCFVFLMKKSFGEVTHSVIFFLKSESQRFLK